MKFDCIIRVNSITDFLSCLCILQQRTSLILESHTPNGMKTGTKARGLSLSVTNWERSAIRSEAPLMTPSTCSAKKTGTTRLTDSGQDSQAVSLSPIRSPGNSFSANLLLFLNTNSRNVITNYANKLLTVVSWTDCVLSTHSQRKEAFCL